MPLPDPRSPAGRRVLLAAAAVLLAVLAVVWYGWSTTAGQVRPTVTGYRVESDTLVRVGYDLVRPEGTAVTCRVAGLDSRKGRVGVVEDRVPAQGPAVVHRTVEVRTSARAVTGVVESCTRVTGG
ncbi:DUF4307 domain-containing protein [Phycicoccus endophyticus]|uniref:DUF4307 domain-containing protein n=1 Tax=Phycicoccus endophyticus TaxID=1690220 RepID=UPI00197B2727|nr:DUF4307 domain-containing protein [Phycicoccus endophyticus]GGL35395.1 hypothetical protein GCM10012283_17310 [Phycicoccus endophyticus]